MGCTDEQLELAILRDTKLSRKRGRPRIYPDLRTQWRERQKRYRKAKQEHLKVYHRSLTIEWATPQAFFDAVHAEFSFTLDVAAHADNAKCARYFTEADDGLAQP
jgi:DNA N-6-adenine-methyltransferase (Dam)